MRRAVGWVRQHGRIADVRERDLFLNMNIV